MTGKEHNDEFYMDGERVRTKTNRSGGIQGGISNGENIIFRVAFKPTATIMTEQQTVSQSGKTPNSREEVGMTPVFFQEQCRWLNQWRRLSFVITL